MGGRAEMLSKRISSVSLLFYVHEQYLLIYRDYNALMLNPIMFSIHVEALNYIYRLLR
jgi:hypothetical protein